MKHCNKYFAQVEHIRGNLWHIGQASHGGNHKTIEVMTST